MTKRTTRRAGHIITPIHRVVVTVARIVNIKHRIRYSIIRSYIAKLDGHAA